MGLTTYFLTGAHKEDVSKANPLGRKGKVATGYAKLLQRMWTGAHACVSPAAFRAQVAEVASRFSDNQQQDAQELLAFLLDALHEDLNRVFQRNPKGGGSSSPSPEPLPGFASRSGGGRGGRSSPGVGASNARGTPAKAKRAGRERSPSSSLSLVVAATGQRGRIRTPRGGDRDEKAQASRTWSNHLRMNQSVIVDTFQGQYRSKLSCPQCKAASTTFDPFMCVAVQYCTGQGSAVQCSAVSNRTVRCGSVQCGAAVQRWHRATGQHSTVGAFSLVECGAYGARQCGACRAAPQRTARPTNSPPAPTHPPVRRDAATTGTSPSRCRLARTSSST